MALTPLDVENTRFRGALTGYSRGEVDQFMQRAARTLEELLETIAGLKEQVANLEADVAKYREGEEVLKNSMVLAQRTCDELIAAAHKQADAIKREAQAEGHEYKLQLAEVRSQREQFEYAFHGLLSGFLHRLEQGNPQLAGLREDHRELSGADSKKPAAEPEQPIKRDVLEPLETPEPVPAGPAEPAAAHAPGQQVKSPYREVPTLKPPVVPGVPAPATPGAEVDRDADIDDFASALDNAPGKEPPVWPELKEVLEEIPVASSQPAPQPVTPDAQADPPGLTEVEEETVAEPLQPDDPDPPQKSFWG